MLVNQQTVIRTRRTLIGGSDCRAVRFLFLDDACLVAMVFILDSDGAMMVAHCCTRDGCKAVAPTVWIVCLTKTKVQKDQ
jgi:hypothetical protein